MVANRYRLDRLLETVDGRRAHLADDLTRGERVEVRLRDGDTPRPGDDAAMLREGRVMGRRTIAGLAPVIEVTSVDGDPVVVTEHIAGATLAEFARTSAPVAPPLAVRHAVTLCEVLIALRPELPERHTAWHRSATVTHEGALVVTAIRIAPLPAQGPDPAVAAVAATLYSLLTARDAAAPFEIPEAMNVPAPVREAVTGALTGRVATLEDLLAGLRGSAAGRASRRPWDRTELAVAGALAVVLVLLLAGLVGQCTGGGGGGGTAPGDGDAPAITITEVPDLVGLEEGDAVDRAEGAGFTTSVVRRPSDTAPEGTVFAQAPAAGADTPAGSRVVIRVSTGPVPVRVPDVRGLPLGGARQVLNSDGLRIGGLASRPAPGPSGQVVDQDPPPGTGVPPGSEVSLVLDAD